MVEFGVEGRMMPAILPSKGRSGIRDVLRHLIPQRHVGKHHSGQRLKQDARDHQTVSVAHLSCSCTVL